jgi:hypothetical protein
MARQRVKGRRPATRAALIVWVCVAAALTSCHARTQSPLADRLLGAGDLTGFTPGPSTLVTDAGVWAKHCPSGEAARLRTAGFVAGSSEHLTASNLRGRDAVSFVTQFRSVASASADVLHALRTHPGCSTASQLSTFRVPAIPGAYGIAAERSDGAGYDVLFSDGAFSYDVGAFTPDRSGRPTAHDVAVAAAKLYLRVHAREAGGSDASSFQIRATSPRVRTPSPTPRGSGSLALPAAWTRIPPNAELFGPNFEMSAVTAGGPGLVAVGSAEVDRRIGRHDISAVGAIWTSSDGLQWRRVAQSQTGYGAINDVAAGTDGLVAVGADATFTNGAVWTSPNGEVWNRLPMDRAVFGRAAMSAVAPFGSGFVAIGDSISGDRLDRPTAWVSADGTRWERRVVPGRPNAFWSDVTSFRGHLFAVGTVGGPDPKPFVAAVWSSADGRAWVRTAHFPASLGSAPSASPPDRTG